MRSPGWILGLGGLVGLGILLGRSSSASAKTPPAGSAPKPIIVIGDSFAVGVAAQLRGLLPGATIENYAVVGAPSSTMVPAVDEDVDYFVSAGTNDCAARSPDEAMVRSILRVLGPYGAGTATQGALFYLLPHHQMPGELGERCAALVEMLDAYLPTPSPRFFDDGPAASPSAPDGIHFSPDGYKTIAQQAMRFWRIG